MNSNDVLMILGLLLITVISFGGIMKIQTCPVDTGKNPEQLVYTKEDLLPMLEHKNTKKRKRS